MSVLLSICIPTYNRVDKLKRQVENLLSVDDNRFNIVVSDNNSTDETSLFLGTITDCRLKVVRQNSVTGSRNILHSMLPATGKYVLLLLDKDKINTLYLGRLLDELETTTSQYGFCSLKNENPNTPSEIVPNSKQGFIKMSYTCKHPSGDFFKTEIVRQEIRQLDTLLNENFPFVPDILFAHFSSSYEGLIIHFPVVYTETEDEAAAKKSFTYNSENLWFSPSQVIKRYHTFLRDLEEIKVAERWRKSMRKKLVERCFSSGTKGYAYFLKNKKICEHYGVATCNISKNQLMKLNNQIYKSFCSEELGVGKLLTTYLYLKNIVRIFLF